MFRAIGVPCGTLTMVTALMVLPPLPLLEGLMRDPSRMSVAVAAILLALSSSPLGVWADSRSAQSSAPTFETPRESPGAGSSEPPSAAVLDPLTVQAVLGREVRSVADSSASGAGRLRSTGAFCASDRETSRTASWWTLRALR